MQAHTYAPLPCRHCDMSPVTSRYTRKSIAVIARKYRLDVAILTIVSHNALREDATRNKYSANRYVHTPQIFNQRRFILIIHREIRYGLEELPRRQF